MFVKTNDKKLLTYVKIMEMTEASTIVFPHTLAGVGRRRQNVAGVA